jgi:subtilisin family serine protease
VTSNSTSRAALAVASLVTALAVGVAPAVSAAPSGTGAAGGGTARQGYIVTLREAGAVDADEVRAAAHEQLAERSAAAEATRTYAEALPGYAARLTPGEAESLEDDPAVVAVEPDVPVHTQAAGPARVRPVAAPQVQSGPPWGLDRIDQRELPLSGTYAFGGTGAGVTAYLVDSGLRASHVEFQGRATGGFDAVDGGAIDDCDGHGTHVASTLGGHTFGVAKDVRLVPVRVLGCDGAGALSDLIGGLDWVIADHVAGEPAVANLSLGGVDSVALDEAVGRLIADGITVVVAAGNGEGDACASSPARVPGALTVAATDRRDDVAPFSNTGSCVDLAAPGVEVPGASNGSDTASGTMNGTSMASPHVAGVAARLLGADPAATPAEVSWQLVVGATVGAVDGLGRSTPNRLLHAAP